MTAQVRRTLRAFKKNIEKNTPIITKKLAKNSGVKPDPAAVFSAAKYYNTLKKLAKE